MLLRSLILLLHRVPRTIGLAFASTEPMKRNRTAILGFFLMGCATHLDVSDHNGLADGKSGDCGLGFVQSIGGFDHETGLETAVECWQHQGGCLELDEQGRCYTYCEEADVEFCTRFGQKNLDADPSLGPNDDGYWSIFDENCQTESARFEDILGLSEEDHAVIECLGLEINLENLEEAFCSSMNVFYDQMQALLSSGSIAENCPEEYVNDVRSLLEDEDAKELFLGDIGRFECHTVSTPILSRLTGSTWDPDSLESRGESKIVDSCYPYTWQEFSSESCFMAAEDGTCLYVGCFQEINHGAGLDGINNGDHLTVLQCQGEGCENEVVYDQNFSCEKAKEWVQEKGRPLPLLSSSTFPSEILVGQDLPIEVERIPGALSFMHRSEDCTVEVPESFEDVSFVIETQGATKQWYLEKDGFQIDNRGVFPHSTFKAGIDLDENNVVTGETSADDGNSFYSYVLDGQLEGMYQGVYKPFNVTIEMGFTGCESLVYYFEAE